MSCKIIVIGDINGQIHSVFKKLAVLHEKNNFSFAIVTGNLFSGDPEDLSSVNDLIVGNISIPLTTYFTVGDAPLPQQIVDRIKEDQEITPNLYFLGKRSITKTLEGVKIVTLGGKPEDSVSSDVSKEQYLPFHTKSDAKALKRANSADILLTTSWPAHIRNCSNIEIADDVTSPIGYEHISTLCSILKPRYHLTRSPEFFFEREPFINDQTPETPSSRSVTRFISLAAHDLAAPLPSGTTDSPWSIKPKDNKRQALDPELNIGNETLCRHVKRNKRENGRYKQKKSPPGPEDCFFCLSNPKLETHLISSIGEDAYLTNAKGPLTAAISNNQFDIDFPAHVLIIPLTHSPTLTLIPEEENIKEKTISEMHRYKQALQSMIAKKSGNRLGAVTYEISKTNGVHIHWQFVPVPEDIINKGLVEAAFMVEAENLSYPKFEIRDPLLNLSCQNFFRAWIWTPPSGNNPQGDSKCISLSFDEDLRFSLQFGRNVLAKLLGLNDRIQWRDCVQSEEAETNDVEKFKAAFKEFDFTL